MISISQYSSLAASVKIEHRKRKSVLIEYDKSLKLIGEGRSAYVFKILNTNLAMKVFFPKQESTAIEEASIYQKIQQLPYYPELHESGGNYLVIDYVDGKTLFQCLQEGILVTEIQIKQIDIALELAKEKGLNPSDIHLKNIFITNEQNVKIIDIARFRQTKSCRQWSDLRKVFYLLYRKSYFPKKISINALNFVAAVYKKRFLSYFPSIPLLLQKVDKESVHVLK